jgi:TonB family protein
LKYREIGVADSARNHQANLAEHVSLISMQRPERPPTTPTDTAPRVAATEVPSVPSHSATSATADTGGTADELASAVVWGDDNPVRVVRQSALPSGLTATARPARVEVEIGPDGDVISVQLVQSSGDTNFDDAALAAAKQSVYAPATLNGLPVHGTLTIDYPIAGTSST